ncbi:MAG TPA: polynucleotide adenylyltransferase, partial [Candidatus Woesebacteria bacterium]|nr:polynucleotide adenylyltransferase [Candidatus Woesebacteria bacterium]
MKILLPDKVLEVMTRFKENGALIYVVGGSVRDLILNREVKDWDFTTNLTPDEMKKLFPKNSFCENNFGTFSVVLKSGEIFEITTFRTEKNYSDSRHPDKVEWGKSLEEDVMRRDFTINAMAADTEGEVVDYYSGIDDLQKGIIKTVGEADLRFQEDGLRMMRAVRLASQLGFVIEENTFESIIRNAKLINKISGERVRDEIFKILLTNKPADGIKLLKNSGLLAEIMPETLKGVDMVQRGHHIFDVWNHN